MTLKEALDAFEITAQAELIKRLANLGPNPTETASKIEEGLAEGRKAANPLISAVFGSEAVTAWKRSQEKEVS